ncbi:MAG: citrate lyase holo-[acyl-carrier protein] synthase [Bacteroidales bacterium]|nr:citrate lyase holo-[acyl-carrier protein] synthase [Bacteroidales bacterium]
MTITLEMLLESRDARAQHQHNLMKNHPSSTLVCLTVVMPGNEKRNPETLTVAHAAVEALKQLLDQHIEYWEEKDLETGYEAYVLTELDAKTCKEMTCQIEDTHPLGRLFDIDVIAPNGIPISRTEVGHQPRKCLLCDREARYCMRNFTHTQDEIHVFIKQLIASYQSSHQS